MLPTPRMPSTDNLPSRTRQRVGLVVFATVFLDMIGTGIILPLLPFYVRSMHGSATTVGVLLASFSFAQLIATPLLGRLSDRVGRRPVVVLSLLGNAVSMVVFALAARTAWLPMLFVSRMVAGATAGNLAACQAAIADVYDGPDRARAMGRVGAGIGMGIVVGPVLGGALSSMGPAFPPLGAALLASVDLVAALMFMPETRMLAQAPKPVDQGAFRTADVPAEAPPPRLLPRMVRPPMVYVLGLYFLNFLCMSNVQVALALFARERFGWNGSRAGALYGLFGAGSVLMQAVGVGGLTRALGEVRLVILGSLSLALGMVVIASAPAPAVLVTGVLLVGVGIGSVNPPLSSLASSLADPRQRGSVLGIAQSAGGLARAVGPLCGGLLFTHVGIRSPFWLGAAAAVLAATAGRELLRAQAGGSSATR